MKDTIANASPPMPFEVGSTTVNAAAVAIAASIALPPERKICNPACAASGCDVATIPCCAKMVCRFEVYGWCRKSNGLPPFVCFVLFYYTLFGVDIHCSCGFFLFFG